MTPPSDNKDNSFPAFAFGLTIGILGALAFGTEEGRKIVGKLIDSIPNKYKAPPVTVSPKMPILPVEETPHHAYFEAESPPPPPPAVRPTLSEPFKPQV